MDAAKVKVVNLTIATNRRVYMDLLGIPYRLNHLTIRKSFVATTLHNSKHSNPDYELTTIYDPT